MKHRSPYFVFAALLLGVSALPSAASAQSATASMNVTPLRLEVPTQEASTQMLIRNRAKTDLNVQLRVFEWRQIDGENRYSPTYDVQVSPSIVSIEPGEAQSFHVIADGARAVTEEKRYRVVIDELPGDYTVRAGVAQTTMRLTVPLFVDRDASAKGVVEVAETQGALRIRNSGEQTVRLAGIRLSSGGQPIALKPNDTMRYVHGGSWVEIPLPVAETCKTDPILVAAQADRETYDATAEQVCT